MYGDQQQIPTQTQNKQSADITLTLIIFFKLIIKYLKKHFNYKFEFCNINKYLTKTNFPSFQCSPIVFS